MTIIFERTQRTITKLMADVPGHSYLSLRIENITPSTDWNIYLKDYDDNVGAIGVFDSEEQAVSNIQNFLDLAIPAYEKKYAKMGKTPIIRYVDGVLTCIVEETTEGSLDDSLFYETSEE